MVTRNAGLSGRFIRALVVPPAVPRALALAALLFVLGVVPAGASGQRRETVASRPGDAAIAILLACQVERVSPGACQSFLRVAFCESRLDPRAINGQYKGLFQLSARHRSDPIIRALGWRDAYAEALHTVRYVKRHGWGEWQCRPEGGLRW